MAILCLFTINLMAQETFISEIYFHSGNTGTEEAIEIAGLTGNNLDNWSLVLYDGISGMAYNTQTFDESDVFSYTMTLDNTNYGVITAYFGQNGIQDNFSAIALVDNVGNVVEFWSYDGTILAMDGSAIGLTSQDIGESATVINSNGLYSLDRRCYFPACLCGPDDRPYIPGHKDLDNFMEECGVEEEEDTSIKPCGVYPTETDYIYEENRTSINPLPSGELYNIPLRIIVITEDDGLKEGSMDNFFEEQLIETNANFPEELNFYICEVELLKNSLFYNYNTSEREALFALNYKPNYINVYIVNSIVSGNTPYSGLAAYPNPSDPFNEWVFLSKGANKDRFLLAHELGHVFGLLHTHSPFENGLPTPPDFFVRGDFIDNTPLDPGTQNCGSVCENPCTSLATDGQTYDYYPLRDNIMSYYPATCGGNFTHTAEGEDAPGQVERMLDFAMNERSNLLSATPTCNGIDFSQTFGKIRRVRRNAENSAWEYDNFPNAPIDIRSGGNGCYRETDEEGNYYLENCPLNGGFTVPEPRKEAPSNPNYNCNNGISTFDLAKIQKHILRNEVLRGPYFQIAADVNQSGTITNADQIAIRNVILNNEDCFPSGSWRFVPRFMFHRAFDSGRETGFNNRSPFGNVWEAIVGAPRDYFTSYLDKSILHSGSVHAVVPQTWSFDAIKMGDVNGSASIEGANMAAGNEVNICDELVQIESIDCIEANKNYLITFQGFPTGNIGAYQLGLTYDNTVFEVNSIEAGNFEQFNPDNFSINQEEGQLRAIWVDDNLEDQTFNQLNNHWFTARVTALQNQCAFEPKSVFTLHKELNPDNIQSLFHTIDGEHVCSVMKMTISPIQNIGTNSLNTINAYPNPTIDHLSFNLNLTEASTVIIEITDETNTIVHEGSFAEGENTETIDISNLNSGILYYRAIIGDEVLTGSVIKI